MSEGVDSLKYLEIGTKGNNPSIQAGKIDGEPTMYQQFVHLNAVRGWYEETRTRQLSEQAGSCRGVAGARSAPARGRYSAH